MSTARAPENSTWRRHLQGWRAGLLTVVLAGLGASVAVPRATTPHVLPYPSYDAARARSADRIEQERARSAWDEPLAHSTRRIGELVRRLGLASTNDPVEAQRLERTLRAEVRKHLADGHAEALLRLRALQAALFLDEVRDWERSGQPSIDLAELGGDFAERAAQGWRKSSGTLLFDDEELRLLFRVRWGLLTGTHRVQPFGPSLNEFRQYYSLLIAHPSGATPHDRALSRLAAVAALGRIDDSYPVSFARGVLLTELGDLGAAAQAFESHLRAHPDGPWTLLARNHLLATRPPAAMTSRDSNSKLARTPGFGPHCVPFDCLPFIGTPHASSATDCPASSHPRRELPL